MTDLELLPDGDLTEVRVHRSFYLNKPDSIPQIGEKGISEYLRRDAIRVLTVLFRLVGWPETTSQCQMPLAARLKLTRHRLTLPEHCTLMPILS
jgi:hypothetical protein